MCDLTVWRSVEDWLWSNEDINEVRCLPGSNLVGKVGVAKKTSRAVTQ